MRRSIDGCSAGSRSGTTCIWYIRSILAVKCEVSKEEEAVGMFSPEGQEHHNSSTVVQQDVGTPASSGPL